MVGLEKYQHKNELCFFAWFVALLQFVINFVVQISIHVINVARIRVQDERKSHSPIARLLGLEI